MLNKIILIVPLFLLIASCHRIEKEYIYGEETFKKIKKIKRNKEFTYIDYQFPNPHGGDTRAYLSKKIQYTFKAKKIKHDEAKFALIGKSTKNYGILDRVEGDKRIRLDSVTCDHGETIVLKLNPVVKGNYKIRGWGCRYGKEFDIVIQ